MWVFTENGCFYSAVIDRDVKPFGDGRMVRTRDERSALLLVDFLCVGRGHDTNPALAVRTPAPADYGWRVRCTEGEWVAFLASVAVKAEATNFKSEVQRQTGREGNAGRWLTVLHDVWGVLFDYQAGRTSRVDEMAYEIDKDWS